MKVWLRHHRFALVTALKRLAHQPGSLILNAIVIAIALALPAVGYTLLRGVQPVTKSLAADPELTLYMRLDAARTDTQAAAQRAREAAGAAFAAVQVVPREVALSNLKAQAGYADVLAALPANPLPDAVVLRLKNEAGTADLADRLANALQSVAGVDHVQVDSAWVRRLEAGLRFLQLGLMMLAIAVGVVVVAVAFNTIRLQALTQRDEAELARLIGATPGFIRRPFLYLGALQGVLGGAIAIALAAAAWWPLDRALADLARAYGSTFRLSGPGPLDLGFFLIASLGLGWIGAALSLSHHLRDTET